MEQVEDILNPKQYYQLECLLRFNRKLTERLASNNLINADDLLKEIIYHISETEYEISLFPGNHDTPSECRTYESGRELLRVITQYLYPKEPERFFYLIGSKAISTREGKRLRISIKR